MTQLGVTLLPEEYRRPAPRSFWRPWPLRASPSEQPERKVNPYELQVQDVTHRRQLIMIEIVSIFKFEFYTLFQISAHWWLLIRIRKSKEDQSFFMLLKLAHPLLLAGWRWIIFQRQQKSVEGWSYRWNRRYRTNTTNKFREDDKICERWSYLGPSGSLTSLI